MCCWRLIAVFEIVLTLYKVVQWGGYYLHCREVWSDGALELGIFNPDWCYWYAWNGPQMYLVVSNKSKIYKISNEM